MQILLTIFLLSFIYGFSGALTPGPVLTGVIVDTPKGGIKTGPLYILGHAILESIVVIASFFGLSYILNIKSVFVTISICGSIVLSILAILLLKNVKKTQFSDIIQTKNDVNNREKDLKSKKNWFSLIFAGIYLSVSNPFWIIWWATAGLAHMDSLNVFLFSTIGAVTYFTGHICSDLAWYSLISSMVHLGKNLITDKVYKIILICCACFFIYFALKFTLLVFYPNLYFPI
ncbi:MAG: LysE family transporter [Candidatus Thorarchaeota archaeon]